MGGGAIFVGRVIFGEQIIPPYLFETNIIAGLGTPRYSLGHFKVFLDIFRDSEDTEPLLIDT